MGRKQRSDDETTRLSRKMSAILRHRIAENGLSGVLRPDGYVPLDKLLATNGFAGAGVTAEQVRVVVETNDKQRFSMMEEDGVTYIRANQGHRSTGVEAEALLDRLDEAAAQRLGGGQGLAVHGTYYGAWSSIVSSGGLSRMTRHHIHLAEGLPGEAGVISGMRKSAEVFVWVDVLRAMRMGVTFYLSQNRVVLTPGREVDGLLPLEAFASVVDHSGRVWRDGGWHAADS